MFSCSINYYFNCTTNVTFLPCIGGFLSPKIYFNLTAISAPSTIMYTNKWYVQPFSRTPPNRNIKKLSYTVRVNELDTSTEYTRTYTTVQQNRQPKFIFVFILLLLPLQDAQTVHYDASKHHKSPVKIRV